MNSDVLVLNRNYYATSVAPWQNAFTLVCKGAAHVLDSDFNTYDFDTWKDVSQTKSLPMVHTVNFQIAVPEIIVLKFYDELPISDVRFTRSNIYKHYGYKCAYCGKRFHTDELNLDHVVPKAQGGQTGWENIVLSCMPCNSKKADRTPIQANMKLRYVPDKPLWKPSYVASLRTPMKVKVSWQKFIDEIYWGTELERG